jgi:hypothetical protein
MKSIAGPSTQVSDYPTYQELSTKSTNRNLLLIWRTQKLLDVRKKVYLLNAPIRVGNAFMACSCRKAIRQLTDYVLAELSFVLR